MKDFKLFVRSLPCLINIGCEGIIELHHVKSRGAGGKDKGNIIPLCTKHHINGIHFLGRKTFEKMFHLDLKREAELIFNKWENN